MRSLLLYTFFVLLSVQTFGQKTIDEVLQQYNAETIPYISVEELRRLQLHDTVMILDARERVEFDVSRIPSAQYIGYSEFSSEKTLQQLANKNQTVVVYCTLGVRSETIGEKLKKAGFTDVKNLYGGIVEWKNKDFPVIDSLGAETQQVHTASKFWGQWLKKGVGVHD